MSGRKMYAWLTRLMFKGVIWLSIIYDKILGMFVSHRKFKIFTAGSYKYAIPVHNNEYHEDYRVFLCLEEGNEIDITQPPGTIYPYTPSELGGVSYKLVKTTGEITYIYDKLEHINMHIKRRKLQE